MSTTKAKVIKSVLTREQKGGLSTADKRNTRSIPKLPQLKFLEKENKILT